MLKNKDEWVSIGSRCFSSFIKKARPTQHEEYNDLVRTIKSKDAQLNALHTLVDELERKVEEQQEIPLTHKGKMLYRDR